MVFGARRRAGWCGAVLSHRVTPAPHHSGPYPTGKTRQTRRERLKFHAAYLNLLQSHIRPFTEQARPTSQADKRGSGLPCAVRSPFSCSLRWWS